jgi:hypothetical protein
MKLSVKEVDDWEGIPRIAIVDDDTERPEWCRMSEYFTLASEKARADELARRWNAHEELVEALEAMIARVEGEWDHPALVKYGPLRTMPEVDMAIIARAALEKLGKPLM